VETERTDAADIYKSGAYWDKNSTFHEEDAEFKVAHSLPMLKRHGVEVKSIVDVGCGSGKHAFLLTTALDVPTTGLDISEKSIERAKGRWRHPKLGFQLVPIGEYAGRASLGVMFDVFEHVDDYLGFLKVARPKADYWLFNIPLDMHVSALLRDTQLKCRAEVGHLHYFSRETALATLRDCGYRVIEAKFAFAVFHALRAKPTLKGYLAALPRLFLFAISPSLCVKLLGGASLIVLCEGKPSPTK
jgi:SAM-dependent methyltransferase